MLREADFTPTTDLSAGTPEQVRAKVAEARARGYALDRGESFRGILGVAAPLAPWRPSTRSWRSGWRRRCTTASRSPRRPSPGSARRCSRPPVASPIPSSASSRNRAPAERRSIRAAPARPARSASMLGPDRGPRRSSARTAVPDGSRARPGPTAPASSSCAGPLCTDCVQGVALRSSRGTYSGDRPQDPARPRSPGRSTHRCIKGDAMSENHPSAVPSTSTAPHPANADDDYAANLRRATLSSSVGKPPWSTSTSRCTG